MTKPTVYIETTIAGHVASKLSSQGVVAAQMLATRQWWDESRPSFDCYTSQMVLFEASQGDPTAAEERLAVLSELPIALPSDAKAVDMLAQLLLSRSALPKKAQVDAVHVAIAAVTGMMYLLTWNCRHLANATLRGKIEQACRDTGYEPPIICTPLELREVQR